MVLNAPSNTVPTRKRKGKRRKESTETKQTIQMPMPRREAMQTWQPPIFVAKRLQTHTHTHRQCSMCMTRMQAEPHGRPKRRFDTPPSQMQPRLRERPLPTRNSMWFKIALATLRDVGGFQPCLTGRRCPCLLRTYQASSLLHALWDCVQCFQRLALYK